MSDYTGQADYTQYTVVNKREYPSSEKLKEIDAICISGSFVDDAGTDTAWISRLCGFVSICYCGLSPCFQILMVKTGRLCA